MLGTRTYPVVLRRNNRNDNDSDNIGRNNHARRPGVVAKMAFGAVVLQGAPGARLALTGGTGHPGTGPQVIDGTCSAWPMLPLAASSRSFHSSLFRAGTCDPNVVNTTQLHIAEPDRAPLCHAPQRYSACRRRPSAPPLCWFPPCGAREEHDSLDLHFCHACPCSELTLAAMTRYGLKSYQVVGVDSHDLSQQTSTSRRRAHSG
jgi:hypothetical protein